MCDEALWKVEEVKGSKAKEPWKDTLVEGLRRSFKQFNFFFFLKKWCKLV